MTAATLIHHESGIRMVNGIPHVHVSFTAAHDGHTHPYSLLLHPGSQTNVEEYVRLAQTEIEAYSGSNRAYTALEGTQIESCHRTMTIHDCKIQIHGFRSCNIIVTATGTWMGQEHYYRREWHANAVAGLPSVDKVV